MPELRIIEAERVVPSGAKPCILTKPSSIKNGKKMSPCATLSSKFQISIPKPVREAHQWKAGQEFVFIPKGQGVLLMPVPELKQLAGIAQGAQTHDIRDRADRY